MGLDAAKAALDGLDETTGGVFRTELIALMDQLRALEATEASESLALKEMAVQLEDTRAAYQASKADEDELAFSIRQAQEDASRLSDDVHRARLANMSTENGLRDVRARVAALESARDLGTGWTGDQLSRQTELQAEFSESAAELESRQRVLAALRADVAAAQAAVEASQSAKADVEATIAALRSSIVESKGALAAATRGREAADKELSDKQDIAIVTRHELARLSKETEEGLAALQESQAALRDEKASLDANIKSFDRLRASTARTNESAEEQIAANRKLAAELQELETETLTTEREASRVAAEARRLAKLQTLALAKIADAERRYGDEAAAQVEVRRATADLDDAIKADRRLLEAQRASLESALREKSVIGRALAATGDKSKDAAVALALQLDIKRSLQSEVATAGARLRDLRTEISALLELRAKRSEAAEAAKKVHSGSRSEEGGGGGGRGSPLYARA